MVNVILTTIFIAIFLVNCKQRKNAESSQAKQVGINAGDYVLTLQNQMNRPGFRRDGNVSNMSVNGVFTGMRLDQDTGRNLFEMRYANDYFVNQFFRRSHGWPSPISTFEIRSFGIASGIESVSEIGVAVLKMVELKQKLTISYNYSEELNIWIMGSQPSLGARTLPFKDPEDSTGSSAASCPTGYFCIEPPFFSPSIMDIENGLLPADAYDHIPESEKGVYEPDFKNNFTFFCNATGTNTKIDGRSFSQKLSFLENIPLVDNIVSFGGVSESLAQTTATLNGISVTQRGAPFNLIPRKERFDHFQTELRCAVIDDSGYPTTEQCHEVAPERRKYWVQVNQDVYRNICEAWKNNTLADWIPGFEEHQSLVEKFIAGGEEALSDAERSDPAAAQLIEDLKRNGIDKLPSTFNAMAGSSPSELIQSAYHTQFDEALANMFLSYTSVTASCTKSIGASSCENNPEWRQKISDYLRAKRSLESTNGYYSELTSQVNTDSAVAVCEEFPNSMEITQEQYGYAIQADGSAVEESVYGWCQLRNASYNACPINDWEGEELLNSGRFMKTISYDKNSGEIDPRNGLLDHQYIVVEEDDRSALLLVQTMNQSVLELGCLPGNQCVRRQVPVLSSVPRFLQWVPGLRNRDGQVIDNHYYGLCIPDNRLRSVSQKNGLFCEIDSKFLGLENPACI